MKTRIAEFGAKLWQRTAFFRFGAGLAIIAVAFVGLRLAWLQFQRPAHLNAIAAAYGSINNLSSRAQFNHDCSRLTYVTYTEARGVGLFMCDTATDRKQLVDVQTYGAGEYGNGFNVTAWPWSPDDTAFIYSKDNSLFICPADTNLTKAEIDLGTNAVPLDLVWLNPSEFVWLEAGAIVRAQKGDDGKWTLQKLPHKGQITSLIAIGSHSIAWVQDNSIHRLDVSQDFNSFSPDTSTAWLGLQSELKIHKLMALSYNRQTGRLLIDDTDNGLHTVWCLNTESGSRQPVKTIQGYFLRNVQWTGTDTLACSSADAKHPALLLADVSGKQTKPALTHERIDWFRMAPDQKRVFLFGAGTNEPISGIWEYSLDSGKLTPIVSGTEHPSAYAKTIEPSNLTFQSSSGQTIKYTIFPPANFSRHRKYPLVIGDTVIWDRTTKANMAACGAYVALVTRDSWWKGMEDWEANVRALYDQLKQQPYIDTSRVYMIGTSAEIRYMGQSLAKTPGLWKGAIFLDCDNFPDFSEFQPFQNKPKILICADSEDHVEPRIKQFQQDMIKQGIVVEYVIHPGENHVLVGTAAKLARLQAIASFFQEDQP